MVSEAPRIVVIGAGLAGLAAARHLQAAGLHVCVLERAKAVGGRARTLVDQGYQIELGAEFLASFYQRTMALIGELGIAQDLRRIPSSSAIFRAGRFYTLWPNVRAAFSRIVGSRHKLALSYLLASLVRHTPLLDLRAFNRAHPIDDDSVSGYARSHLSEDLLEYLLQPALSGIFYWTPERTSRALLMLVLRAGLSRPTGLQLYTLRDGIGQLATAMARGLDLYLGADVESVLPRAAAGFNVRYRVGGDMRVIEADAIVVATTAPAVLRLLPWLDDDQRAFFGALRYSSTALLAVGTLRHLPREYYGLLFPRRESAFLASATLQSVKSPVAVPRGRDMLALHMSGPAASALRDCGDSVIARILLAEIRRMAPRYDPERIAMFQRLIRCDEALPEFDVGHFQRLQHFADGAIERPGLIFAGDYLGGPFVEGAILSGEAAAARLIRSRPTTNG